MDLVASIQKDAHFHYHNPVKSRREISDAYLRHGCRRFAVDCREEVAKIAAIAGADRSVELAVRFVLPRERTSSAMTSRPSSARPSTSPSSFSRTSPGAASHRC